MVLAFNKIGHVLIVMFLGYHVQVQEGFVQRLLEFQSYLECFHGTCPLIQLRLLDILEDYSSSSRILELHPLTARKMTNTHVESYIKIIKFWSNSYKLKLKNFGDTAKGLRFILFPMIKAFFISVLRHTFSARFLSLSDDFM